MAATSVTTAEAKKRVSELVGRVACGGETGLITRQGRPMVKLIPVTEPQPGLADVKGWLSDDDPFLSAIDGIVAARDKNISRVLSPKRKKHEPLHAVDQLSVEVW